MKPNYPMTACETKMMETAHQIGFLVGLIAGAIGGIIGAIIGAIIGMVLAFNVH